MFFRSAPAASSVASATDQVIPAVPQTGWYDLLMNRRHELIANSEATLIQLQRVLAQWKDHIPGITVFITNMSHKLDTLKQEHPGREIELGPWNVFFAELKKCIDELSAFAIIASDKKNNTPQIIVAGIERIKMWPTLIKAFNNLELDLIVSGLFPTSAKMLDQAKQQASNLSVTSILPPYQIEKLQSSVTWVETNLGPAFSSFPETVQDAILIAASELNTLFRHVYLMLDKVASQTGFDQKKLAHEPIFTSGSQKEEKSVEPPTLSFHQLAAKFRVMYANCMARAGYALHEEYYPFPSAVLAQRRSFPAALSRQWESEAQAQDARWAKAKQESLDIIQAKIRQLADENGWISRTTSRMEKLEELKNVFPSTCQKLDFDIMQHIKHITEKDVVDQIQAVYTNLIARSHNRAAWFAQQERNIQDLIKLAEDEHAAVTSNVKNDAYKAATQRELTLNEMMAQDVPALIGHTQQLISILTRPSDSDSQETIFDNILATMQQCEAKLKEILDEKIYKDWFEGDRFVNLKFDFISHISQPAAALNQESKYDDIFESNLPNISGDDIQIRIEANTAWINHVAQLIKQIKKVAHEAKILQTKSDVNKRPLSVPAVRFQNTMRQTDVSIVSLSSLMGALNDLRKNPVVKALPPIGAILSGAIPAIQRNALQAVVDPLSHHPLQQAWFDRDGYASPEDQLQGGLQHILRIFLGLLDQSDKDDVIKQKAAEGLQKADGLLDDFQQEKSAVAFIFKNPRRIYKVVKRLSDLFTTLFTLSGDQLLLAAEQINDAIYNLFLLFDKLEIQFYMKEQYIANLISISGQSLPALAKSFSDAVKDQGYVFPPDKCYPYTQGILAQRKELLRSYPHDISTKEFIQRRIQKSDNDLRTENHAVIAEQKIHQSNLKRDILLKLQKREQALVREYESSCIGSSTQSSKIALLHSLYTQLEPLDVVHLNMHSLSKQDRGLLSSGRTGEMFETVLSNTKTDLKAYILNDIARLNRLRRPDGCLFSSQSHNDAIKRKVDALTLLSRYIELSGFRIDDAMKELKEFYHADYILLEKNKKQFLEPLRKIEKRIPEFLIGKKVIGETRNIIDGNEEDRVEAPSNNSSLASDDLHQPLLMNQAGL
jgi:hypothetical protein